MKNKLLLLLPLLLISFAFVSAIDISTCQGLQDIQNDLTASYALTQNIDCSDTINWNGGDGFIPLGYGDAGGEYFSGSFNGQGYTISDLYMYNVSRSLNTDGFDCMGLFGFVDGSSASISNVHLENVNVTGYDNVGGLVGILEYGGNIIDNCSVSGTVRGTGSNQGYVGGLVGFPYTNNIIRNSYSDADVYNTGTAGGIFGIGYAYVDNCYFTGTITAGGCGGIAGQHYGIINNSYSTGDMTCDSVGGIAGYSGGAIYNSYSSGNLNGISDGGIVQEQEDIGIIENCYSFAVTGCGILCTNNAGGTVTNSFWDTEVSGTSFSDGGTGKTTLEMKEISTYTGWNIVTTTNNENSGYPYLLSGSWVIYESQGIIQNIINGVGKTGSSDTLIKQEQLPTEEQTPVTKVSLFQMISGWFQNIINWFKNIFQ